MDNVLTLKYIELDIVVFWDNNTKKHNIPALIESIKKHGFKDPPKFEPALNDGVGGIVEGNGRTEALITMRDRGDDPPRGVAIKDDQWVIPVLFGVDAASEIAAEVYGIDHNNLVMAHIDDENIVAMLWDEKYSNQIDLYKEAGISPISIDVLDGLIGSGGYISSDEPIEKTEPGETEIVDPIDEIDPAEQLLEKWKVKTGDVWVLGLHRLICGDCLESVTMERLFVETLGKPELVWTDPPYNVQYTGSNTKTRDDIENDEMTTDQHFDFISTIANQIKKYTSPDSCDIYMFGAPGHDGMKSRIWMIEAGLHWSATIIWKKHRIGFGMGKYQRQYEPILFGWFSRTSSFVGDRTQSEVWEIDRPTHSPEHPTMKPVELALRAIRNSSIPGAKVLDMFVGSGTIFLAAEQTGRIAFGAEIEPKYCAVALERFQVATGIKPIREHQFGKGETND